jgi:hypothetical protein
MADKGRVLFSLWAKEKDGRGVVTSKKMKAWFD